ncbi:hypothetical protein, partial [Brachybacterium sp. AOP29-B2-41]|uniref:hypothetical protein n=1 Tax=Brachybacterium sp. AOP29-B2-41 TaxID=3457704 RepID=UPI00403336F2
LFDDRIKSATSCLSKLETGTVESLRQLKDFYGAMVVVPTQKELISAKEEIGAILSVVQKERDLSIASNFVYDDLHLHARLRGSISPVVATSGPVLDRSFEIQIHTGLQYAWWRATHDALYKGGRDLSGSWAAQRVSGQARAALEMVDGIISNFEVAARLQKSSAPVDVTLALDFKLLARWPRARRPEDETRFGLSLARLQEVFEVDTGRVEELFDSGILDEYIANPKITPLQVVLIACHMEKSDIFAELAKAAGLKLFITEELLEAYPEVFVLSMEDRVAIGGSGAD